MVKLRSGLSVSVPVTMHQADERPQSAERLVLVTDAAVLQSSEGLLHVIGAPHRRRPP